MLLVSSWEVDVHRQRQTPGSPTFNRKWRQLARDPGFAQDQHSFIKSTHYDPLRATADGAGIPNTKAINEALFSMGVQHGGAKNIVKNANVKTGDSEESVIKKLYNARRGYVERLNMPTGTKRSLLNRYDREEKDVKKLIKNKQIAALDVPYQDLRSLGMGGAKRAQGYARGVLGRDPGFTRRGNSVNIDFKGASPAQRKRLLKLIDRDPDFSGEDKRLLRKIARMG